MIGTDLQSLEELRQKPALYANRAIFTRYEREYCLSKKDAWASFGGLLCAKESCIKLFGAFRGVPQFGFLDLEIKHAENGCPTLHAGARLKPWLDARGLTISISISHSGGYASATAFATMKVAA